MDHARLNGATALKALAPGNIPGVALTKDVMSSRNNSSARNVFVEIAPEIVTRIGRRNLVRS